MQILRKVSFKKKVVHMVYGLTKIIDGLIVIITLGNVHSDLSYNFIVRVAMKFEIE